MTGAPPWFATHFIVSLVPLKWIIFILMLKYPLHVCFIFLSVPLSKRQCQDSFFYKFINLFYILFLAALGLCCCAWAFSSCGKQWLLLLWSIGSRRATSVVVAHGLSTVAPRL